MTTEERLEQGRRLFDLALAAGIDTGRYVLVTTPGRPDLTRCQRGPNFHTLQPDSWIAQLIDDDLNATDDPEPQP